jgi:hypothetical protein
MGDPALIVGRLDEPLRIIEEEQADGGCAHGASVPR